MHHVDKILSNLKGNSTFVLVITIVVVFLSWIYLVHMRKFSFSSTDRKPEPVESSVGEKEEDMLAEYEDKIHKLQEQLCRDGLCKQEFCRNLCKSTGEKEEVCEDDAGVPIVEDEIGVTDPAVVKQYVAKQRLKAYTRILSATEKEKEEEAKREQLSQICALLNKEKETFGETSMENVKEQFSMYVQ